ncbi:serine hydrolase [Paenibacillus sp. NEAU-GSW1]|uniref:serine hydrolase domain-containing protein n=1 Tax=Paenibacillus sp. NEAU-GSW1 TaxID=2682486 RepID=UPI0020A6D8B9|nr:serine hydrolase [Paenibacillus sp. NEAU-GSW1]
MIKSSPAEAGLDAAALERLEPLLAEWRMTSVLIARGGQLAYEWHEKGEDSVAPLLSCTKSVLSSLIGIAIEEGRIAGVDQPISDYFGEAADPQIKIKHLLTMTAGWDWPDFDKRYKAMKASADPVGFVLDCDLVHEPGSAYAYNSGGSHLLSVILTKAVGCSALDYASSRLFQPMGFRQAKWTSRRGINEGGTGLQLYSRDLAKFGQLFLQKGNWFGRSLLSADWIEQSTKPHHRALLNYEPPIYGAYGFHWWHSPASHNGAFDCFFAFGHGGQILLVAPEAELVVVVRKRITGRNAAIYSRRLIMDYIVSSII